MCGKGSAAARGGTMQHKIKKAWEQFRRRYVWTLFELVMMCIIMFLMMSQFFIMFFLAVPQ